MTGTATIRWICIPTPPINGLTCAEGISDVYGLVGNLIIARDTLIENFVAGSGNDIVIGNEAANLLEGRSGDDELLGNAGQ